jgi:membrane-associated phospholipid phosphatase
MIHRLLEPNQGMGERNVRAGKRPRASRISSVGFTPARIIGCGFLAVMLATAPALAQPADTISNEPGPLLTRGDAVTGGIFALGTVAAFPLDKVFASYARGAIQERRFARRVAIVVEEVAVPGAFIIGASLYGVGKLADNKEMADLGLHGSEAIVIGLLFTGGLKVLAGRARPFLGHDEPHNFGLLRGWKNHDYSSFPSGHTLIAFAAASAVTEETRRFWPNSVWIVGTAMYGGAALVGWSRMFDDKHWMSDVAVGGALGIFAGRKVVRFHHTRPDNALDRWLLGVSIVPEGQSGYGWRPIVVPQR